MLPEQSPISHNESPAQVGQVNIEISGLQDQILSKKGEVLVAGNLEEKLPQMASSLLSSEGSEHKTVFERLVHDVRDGKKSAVWTIVGIGGFTIFAATVAGYEFGIRNGRDIHKLYEKLVPHRPKQK